MFPQHLKCFLACEGSFTVKPPQPGPPKDFQPIRNRSLNKEMNVQTSQETVIFFYWLFSILNFWPYSKTLHVFFTAEMQTLLILLPEREIILDLDLKSSVARQKTEVSRYRKCLRIDKIILVSGRAVIMSTSQAFRFRSSAIRYFKPYNHVVSVIQGLLLYSFLNL